MSRLIDADALKRKAQRVATESWKMRLTARIETTLNQFIDWIDNAQTIQPEPSEITDEQAILHLQSTGWMQNHDREIYESGLKEQLADDSESYDSLIPYENAISRQAAIDAIEQYLDKFDCIDANFLDGLKTTKKILNDLPSAQPEYEPVTAEDFAKTMLEVSPYNFVAWHQEALTLMEGQGFVICKKTI